MNFITETIKEKSDSSAKVTLQTAGYEGEKASYQVIQNMFGDSEVYTYRTLKGAEKKYHYLTASIEG